MPTWYTEPVMNGKMTSAKDYILRCAREIDYLSFMRDEPENTPIPETRPEDTYYKDLYDKAKKELSELLAMDENDIHRESEKWRQDKIKTKKEFCEMIALENSRLTEMTKKLDAWQPKHESINNLRYFAIEQLGISRENTGDIEKDIEKIRNITDNEWYENQLNRLNRDIPYWRDQITRKSMSVAVTNQWLKELRESLEGLE